MSNVALAPKPHEFIDNSRSSGKVRWLGEERPQHGEIVYAVTRDEGHPSITLCVVDDHGETYDGGKAGKDWLDLHPLGDTRFIKGQLAVPDHDIDDLRRNWGNQLHGYGYYVIPRSPVSDIMARVLSQAIEDYRQARRDRKELEASFRRIFGDQ